MRSTFIISKQRINFKQGLTELYKILCILVSGSQDCLVKIWHIPENGLQESLSNPECVFSHKQRRVEGVGFHPTADCLLHSTSYTTLTLWDLISQQDFFSNTDHSEVIQSVSWKRDGSLIATSSKDKQVNNSGKFITLISMYLHRFIPIGSYY